MKNKLILEYFHKVKRQRIKAKFIEENLPQNELTATRLGRYRVEIKKYLHKEMKEIDGLVKILVGS